MATGARLPYVGQATASIGPALRHADGPTEGLPIVVPVGPSAANGAAAEEALPEVRPAEGPEVPSLPVPIRPRRPRLLPATPTMGTPHVPMAIATVEEGGTGPEAIPSGEATLPTIPIPRRQALQANVATGRKKVASGAFEVVPEAKDASPRKEAPCPLVAPRVAATIDSRSGAEEAPNQPDHEKRSSTVWAAPHPVDPVPSPPDSNVESEDSTLNSAGNGRVLGKVF